MNLDSTAEEDGGVMVYSSEAGGPASGEYTITPEDGRVRPKHVDE
jgi:hypothetical protein